MGEGYYHLRMRCGGRKVDLSLGICIYVGNKLGLQSRIAEGNKNYLDTRGIPASFHVILQLSPNVAICDDFILGKSQLPV